MNTPFAAPISEEIWGMKYRLKELDGTIRDLTVQDTWTRIAKALAACESNPEAWWPKFYDVLSDFKFLPAGRIISGAGTDRNVTLFNCLAGDTHLPTAEYGVVPISDVAGEYVHVLDGNGKWQLSKVNSFGDQPCATVHLKGGYNGREKRTVRATGGHRWIMRDGSEKITDDLNPGDALKIVNRAQVEESPDYIAGVAHGITYGDGTRRYSHADGSSSYCVRLCGEKTELFEYLAKAGWRHTQPPSFGDDILAVSKPMHLDLKSRPNEGTDVDYLTGFLHGWMATDGYVCERDKRAVISCGAYEADWLKRYGPVAGMEVAYKTKLGDETNYGARNIAIFNVSFKSWTLNPGDFLRTKHRENFGLTRNYPWVVEAIDPVGEPEPVFCPRVLTTDSVQLMDGIHTGQCYVMGTIPDSMDGIFDALKEAALTMQQGGGIGYDFSPLRPKGSPVKGVAADASGPLTFMDVWDAMCRTVMSAGSRRGAMMATMRCDHPDVMDFISAKQESTRLRMFNLSVLVTDAFMEAVENDETWFLEHDEPPAKTPFPGEETPRRNGTTGKFIHKLVRARDLWEKIMRSTYDYAEPGVIFIDRINRDNNLNYMENIAATNPCGEQPLPPYGACLLGSINLTRFIRRPFQKKIEGKKGHYAQVMVEELDEAVRIAVRMMDNVNDVSKFPLPQQAEESRLKRRIGLGVTGLADALAMLGVPYDSPEAVKVAEGIMRRITLAAYQASVDLAREKGAFPAFDAEKYLANETFASRLPDYLKAAIREHGIRNSHLTSIAPTGTISLVAGNVSSGIEPIFAYGYNRKVLQKDGTRTEQRVEDYAVALYRKFWVQNRTRPGDFDPEADLPDYFVSAQTITPMAHVRMQAAIQKWVDTSISKTINVPEDIPFEAFERVYMAAYEMGCKGCTTYRPNDVTGSVISVDEKKAEAPWSDTAAFLVAAQDQHDLNVKHHGQDARDHLFATAEAFGITHKSIKDIPTEKRQDFLNRLTLVFEIKGETVSENIQIAAGVEGMAYEMPSFQEFEAMTQAELTARPDVLPAKAYKVKLGGDPAFYVTVTDIVQHGQRRPFEVFINTKNPEHIAWTTALTRMISAIFRRPHDSSFVVEELKNVFDPKGGGFWHGAYRPSVVAAIGQVLEDHMRGIGYGSFSEPTGLAMPDNTTGLADPAQAVQSTFGMGASCPKCFSFNVKRDGGCETCMDCGHSKCG